MQWTSRIARSRDQKGVITASPIRMAQPCRSLTTFKVTMNKHHPIEHRAGLVALIHVNCKQRFAADA